MTITKIIQCKEMLEAAKGCFAPVAVLHCGKVDESKVKQRMATYRADFEGYLQTVQYGLAIMMFRCCGTAWVKMSDESPKDAEPICGIPASVVYDVCTKYEQVRTNDIESELLANIAAPDIMGDCAALYFGVLDGLLQIPQLKSTDKNKIVNDSKYLQSLIKVGCISDYEAYLLARDVIRLVEAYKYSVSAICGVKMKYLGHSVGEPLQNTDVEAKVATRQWTDSLRQYFNNPNERIAMLYCRSDDDILKALRTWEQDRFEKDGRPIFKIHPFNNKQAFAKAMEENGLISKADSFRKKL